MVGANGQVNSDKSGSSEKSKTNSSGSSGPYHGHPGYSVDSAGSSKTGRLTLTQIRVTDDVLRMSGEETIKNMKKSGAHIPIHTPSPIGY